MVFKLGSSPLYPGPQMEGVNLNDCPHYTPFTKTLAHRRTGTQAHWHTDTMAQRHTGTATQRHNGTTIRVHVRVRVHENFSTDNSDNDSSTISDFTFLWLTVSWLYRPGVSELQHIVSHFHKDSGWHDFLHLGIGYRPEGDANLIINDGSGGVGILLAT